MEVDAAEKQSDATRQMRMQVKGGNTSFKFINPYPTDCHPQPPTPSFSSFLPLPPAVLVGNSIEAQHHQQKDKTKVT